MAIDEAEVRRIAELARLSLGEEEIARMAVELGRIVAYVDQLAELDVSDVPPVTSAAIDRLPLRQDEEQPSLPRELSLAEAPRAVDGGFAVPSFVDE
jgi:aspartyl-tRNA(Asn)/glutamyl-tRNA(Gln) amidotransferase subunit C